MHTIAEQSALTGAVWSLTAQMERDDLAFLGVGELRDALSRHEVTLPEYVASQLRRIRALDPVLRAFVAVDETAAGPEAMALWPSPQTWPLSGASLAVKDNIASRDLPTRAGSRLFEDFRPAEDAAVLARVRRAGSILLGKTRMYELACGLPKSDEPTVRNPWDVSRSVGGSSSGSAAAVAAGMCAVSIGTDTAGSVRVPAALCGVVGYKATRAGVDRDGLIPFSAEHDAVGFLTRGVDDLRVLLSVAGSSGDVTTDPPLGGVRLGVPGRAVLADASPDVARGFEQAVARLREDHGVEPVLLPFPDLTELGGHYGRLVRTEAAATYGEMAARDASLVGRTTRERILSSAGLTAREYVESARAVAAAAMELTSVARSARVTTLALPTTPITAPLLAERERSIGGRTVVLQDHLSLFTILASAFDLPALTVPVGLDGGALPIGLQLVALGPANGELLALGGAAEQRGLRPGRPLRRTAGESS